jgi:putative ABC transport system substrate-binding protein
VSIKRRDFLTLLGGAAVVWPLAARAQRPRLPVVGFLDNGGGNNERRAAALRKGLSELGYVEGRNVAIELRTATQPERLPALVAELIRLKVAVIFTSPDSNAVALAKAATSTIPIVFAIGTDPVALGFVASLNRPGGNVTGVTFITTTLMAKRLELLRELVPGAEAIGILTNPKNLSSAGDMVEFETGARSVGQRVVILPASTAEEITQAFATIVRDRVGALLVSPDAFFVARRNQLIALADRYQVPTSYWDRALVEAGGLISYGDDRFESLRQGGIYVGRILKGEKPTDLPVLQPVKFELVVNLTTAKAIGLTIPESFLARADEVIE